MPLVGESVNTGLLNLTNIMKQIQAKKMIKSQNCMVLTIYEIKHMFNNVKLLINLSL